MFGGDIAKNIIKAVQVIGVVLLGIGGFYATIAILNVVVGFILGITSDLPNMPNGAQNFTSNISSSFFANMSTTISSMDIAISLLSVAIVIIVFAFGYMYTKGKFGKNKGGGML